MNQTKTVVLVEDGSISLKADITWWGCVLREGQSKICLTDVDVAKIVNELQEHQEFRELCSTFCSTKPS